MPNDADRLTRNMDPLLLPLLCAEQDAAELLAKLISETAEPVIQAIICRKLRVSLRSSDGSVQNQDALDLASSVRALIISELRHLKLNQDEHIIRDFRQYVAVKTYSACADYFREKHPQRWRLKNALRYQLKQNSQFSLWEDERGKWVGGLSVSASQGGEVHVSHHPRGIADVQTLFPEGAPQVPLADLLSLIFEKAGGPLELDQLVMIVAGVQGIKDHPVESYDQDKMLSESLTDHRITVDAALEQHLYLDRLWTEVCTLPPLQRSALLLNLRDTNNDSAIVFLPYLGIASKNEIADLVGLPHERFAELWNELPLEDSAIAQLLGITRQQVINLRKTARERLARRMKALEKGSSRGTR